jgi:hypothetical protein
MAHEYSIMECGIQMDLHSLRRLLPTRENGIEELASEFYG